MKTMVFAVLMLGSRVGAVELSGVRQALYSDGGTGTAWNSLYDNGVGSGGSAVYGGEAKTAQALPAHGLAESGLASRAVPAPAPAGAARAGGVWEGVKNGASQGALAGFYGVLSPAVALMSKGVDRGFQWNVDGYRAFMAAGVVLGVILYVPALAAGAVGGAVGAAAGAVAEAVKPGSTSRWDVERKIFG